MENVLTENKKSNKVNNLPHTFGHPCKINEIKKSLKNLN